MKTTIYDYAGRSKEIEIEEKPIKYILVLELSGDEVGTIYYCDGTKQEFDASNCRCETFFDGYYIVDGENIKKWLEGERDDVY